MLERVISVGDPLVVFDLGKEADVSGLGQQAADMGINTMITDVYGILAWRAGVTEGVPVPRLPVSHPNYDLNDQVIVPRPTVDPDLRERDEYKFAMEAIQRSLRVQPGAKS